MKSVERLSKEKTPASRSEWPRASVIIGASTMWFAATAIDAGGEAGERPSAGARRG